MQATPGAESQGPTPLFPSQAPIEKPPGCTRVFRFADSAPFQTAGTAGGRATRAISGCLKRVRRPVPGPDLADRRLFVASSLVLVEDALVGDGVEHGLGLGEQFGGLWSCRWPGRPLDVSDGGGYFERSEVLAGVQFDALARACGPDARRGVLSLRLSRCHGMCSLCLRDDVSKAEHYNLGLSGGQAPVLRIHPAGVSCSKLLHCFAADLASWVTGLARDLLMAIFGANALTDAFNVAFRIPICFDAWVCRRQCSSQAFVPVLAASKAQHGRRPPAIH